MKRKKRIYTMKPKGPTDGHPSHLHGFIMKQINRATDEDQAHQHLHSQISSSTPHRHPYSRSYNRISSSRRRSPKTNFMDLLETRGPYPTKCGRDECALAYVERSKKYYEQLTGEPVKNPPLKRPASSRPYIGQGYVVSHKGNDAPRPAFEEMLMRRRPDTAPSLMGREGVLARGKQKRLGSKRKERDERVVCAVNPQRAWKQPTGAPMHPPRFHSDHVGGAMYKYDYGSNWASVKGNVNISVIKG